MSNIISLAPTEANIYTALRGFMTSVLPDGMIVRQAQQNRIPEPPDVDFALMTMLMMPRLGTNADLSIDAVFTGSIALNVMTITAVNPNFTGQLVVGSRIYGVDVVAGTFVKSLGNGTGGIGTYNLNNSQTISSQVLAAGQTNMYQAAEVVVQVDVHGPNSTDNSAILSTAFRDPYAVDQFSGYGYDLHPLYADDPKQIPFSNDQQQFENRWVIDLHMQANFTVTVGQQFADQLIADIINVDAVYPPGG